MIFLLAYVHNMSQADAFTNVTAYIENNTQYQYFYKQQPLKYFLKTSIGDCTEKANAICYALIQSGIECRQVHGYKYNIKIKKYRHDFVQAKINGTWVSSEPQTEIVGRGTFW